MNGNYLSQETQQAIENFIANIFTRSFKFATDLLKISDKPYVITEEQIEIAKSNALEILSYFYPPNCVADVKYTSTEEPSIILEMALDWNIIEQVLIGNIVAIENNKVLSNNKSKIQLLH